MRERRSGKRRRRRRHTETYFREKKNNERKERVTLISPLIIFQTRIWIQNQTFCKWLAKMNSKIKSRWDSQMTINKKMLKTCFLLKSQRMTKRWMMWQSSLMLPANLLIVTIHKNLSVPYMKEEINCVQTDTRWTKLQKCQQCMISSAKNVPTKLVKLVSIIAMKMKKFVTKIVELFKKLLKSLDKKQHLSKKQKSKKLPKFLKSLDQLKYLKS